MAGSGKRRRRGSRESARTEKISLALRVTLTVYEIVWTLIREHVLKDAGPGITVAVSR